MSGRIGMSLRRSETMTDGLDVTWSGRSFHVLALCKLEKLVCQA